MNKSLKWWKKAVVYQIYPLSFADSNGDGFGDLKGIVSKLDYLKSLGVDVLWLSPVYQSPMDDNGYDISDYYKIDPIFGTMDDFNELLHKTHDLGMKIIMDLVINHTSDEHVWFKESKKSIDNPYRDYYIWRDEPSDITSVFSGSAWEFDSTTNQYYFHLFSKKQPDLNWDNPNLRTAIYQMINYWLDLGVDGFRLDVIDLIGKDVDHFQLSDGPYLLERLTELKNQCFLYRDIITVGEMPGLSIERAAEITDEKNGYLNMIFQFGHVGLDEVPGKGKWVLKNLDLHEFKQYFLKSQSILAKQGWNSLFLANHDQPRVVSRYGSILYRKESAKMLATILYGMQGTPYIYQGEEIGMTGVKFQELSDYKDVETINMYHEYRAKGWSHDQIMTSIYAKGRDNSRTPFQWDDSLNAGFTNGIPWLKVNDNYPIINAKRDLSDIDGVYPYFQTLIRLRKNLSVFDFGDFQLVDSDNPSHFSYLRQYHDESMLVIGSFVGQSIQVDFDNYHHYQCLISNYPSVSLSKTMNLPPYYAGIYYKKSENI